MPLSSWPAMSGTPYRAAQPATFVLDARRTVVAAFPKVKPAEHDALVLTAPGELAAA